MATGENVENQREDKGDGGIDDEEVDNIAGGGPSGPYVPSDL